MRTVLLGILISPGLGLLLAQTPAWPPRLPRRQFPPDIVPDLSRDVVKVAPLQYKVEVENEQVRVLRAKIGPDETVPIHDAQEGVLVALTEAHVTFIRSDGSMRHVDLESGQVLWIFEGTYSVKNLSDKPVEFLFIEMRAKRARPAAP